MSDCQCENKPVRRFVDLDPRKPSARDFIRTESSKPGAYREPTFADAAAHRVTPVTDAEVARVKRTGRSLAAFLNRRLRLTG